MNDPRPADDLPRSIAIAGAWGYIGRKFLDVALARGLETFAYDPGPAPPDVDLSRVTRVADEAAFYRLRPDLFHLATHPEHRRLDLLLGRPEPLLILDEKPMAEPERPGRCRQIRDASAASPSTLLYDFPELYDPLTALVINYLSKFKKVNLQEMSLQRSKDREDPSNPRNEKRMVPIQYQETVHCLAFVLSLLARLRGGVAGALAGGVRLSGESDPYAPPNPEAYPYVVDGRCRYRMELGGVRVEGLTDFKRGAPWAKRRILRGLGDGIPFEVDASYLEGAKHLRINGVDQGVDPAASSYEGVLATAMRWARDVGREGLMAGPYPNPGFTLLTYGLSSALWRSCRDGREVAFRSAEDLAAWDAGYEAEVPRFPRYPARSGS